MGEERLKDLDDQVEDLLDKDGIQKITSYGWADAETPDEKYVGYAMWQLSPPFECDLDGLLLLKAAAPGPTALQEALLINGTDFEGCMLSARNAFGRMLLRLSESRDAIFNQGFWEDYATTLLWLSIATDRIRDFFITATIKQFVKSNAHDNDIKQMITDAVKISRSTDIQIGSELESLIQAINARRDARNEIVHKIATSWAVTQRNLMKQQHELTPGSSGSKHSKFKHARPDAAQTLVDAAAFARSWYHELVDSGNLIFQLEYKLR